MNSWSKSNDVVSRRIAGETVMVPIRGSLDSLQKLFMLDSVGAYLWDRMDHVRDTDGLIDDVVTEYDVDRATAAGDVAAFLDALQDAGLVDRKSLE